MRFGKAAVALVVVATLTAGTMIILGPGGGNQVAALGEGLIKLSFLAALVFGIVGIIFDRRKFFAIATVAIIVVGMVLYIWFAVGLLWNMVVCCSK